MSIDVERLSVETVDSQPVEYDWTENNNREYGDFRSAGWESWEYVAPDEGDTSACNECGEPITFVVTDGTGAWGHDTGSETSDIDADDDHDAEPDSDYRSDERSGPMMNYYYPCPLNDPEAAARLIVDLPLCVVQIDGDTTAFALTGGGMDLSWEICEAFMRCGYLPPFKYASDLPKMAMTLTDNHRTTLAAARRSCKVLAQWAFNGLERLDDLESYYLTHH